MCEVLFQEKEKLGQFVLPRKMGDVGMVVSEAFPDPCTENYAISPDSVYLNLNPADKPSRKIGSR